MLTRQGYYQAVRAVKYFFLCIYNFICMIVFIDKQARNPFVKFSAVLTLLSVFIVTFWQAYITMRSIELSETANTLAVLSNRDDSSLMYVDTLHKFLKKNSGSGLSIVNKKLEESILLNGFNSTNEIKGLKIEGSRLKLDFEDYKATKSSISDSSVTIKPINSDLDFTLISSDVLFMGGMGAGKSIGLNLISSPVQFNYMNGYQIYILSDSNKPSVFNNSKSLLVDSKSEVAIFNKVRDSSLIISGRTGNSIDNFYSYTFLDSSVNVSFYLLNETVIFNLSGSSDIKFVSNDKVIDYEARRLFGDTSDARLIAMSDSINSFKGEGLRSNSKGDVIIKVSPESGVSFDYLKARSVHVIGDANLQKFNFSNYDREVPLVLISVSNLTCDSLANIDGLGVSVYYSNELECDVKLDNSIAGDKAAYLNVLMENGVY
ncbi:hypothetical protein NMS86_003557 [Vibrio cholerae]|nr:hypothetical protein [Vibrio cholerae]